MGRFKKGATLGTLIGAGLMWLTTTPKGKEVRSKILSKAEELYPELKSQIMDSDAWKTMNKNKYKKLVTKTVKSYTKKHPALKEMGSLLEKMLISQWGKIKLEIAKKRK
jgi:hypothetical protein